LIKNFSLISGPQHKKVHMQSRDPPSGVMHLLYIFFYIGLAYSATLGEMTRVLVKTSDLPAFLRGCHACPGVLVAAGKREQIHAVFCEEKSLSWWKPA
jgi:hypothetical protein